MDTMNFWMDIAMPDLKKLLKMVDVLMINDAEARQLSGQFSLVKAAKAIMEMGPKFLVIKKGEHGALLFHGDHVFFAPAFRWKKYLIQQAPAIHLPVDLWVTLPKPRISVLKI